MIAVLRNMKKNIIETIRLTSEMKQEIQKIAEVTGFKQSDLIRFLLNSSIVQIRSDCNGDYSKLNFGLRHLH